MRFALARCGTIFVVLAVIGFANGGAAATDFSAAYGWVWRAGERFHQHGRLVPDCLGLPHDQQVRQRVYIAASDHKVHAMVIMEARMQDPYLEHLDSIRSPSRPVWLTSPSGELRKTCFVNVSRGEAMLVSNDLYRTDFEMQKRYFIAKSRENNM